jgi:hypothetical protein
LAAKKLMTRGRAATARAASRASLSSRQRGTRIALCTGVSESIYGAHASDPPFDTKFNWLGKALEVSVGLRVTIGKGRASGS